MGELRQGILEVIRLYEVTVRESRFRGEKGLGNLGGRVRVGQPFEVYKGSRNGNVGDIGSHARINKFLIGRHKNRALDIFL